MPYLLYNKCTGKQMCSVCPGFKITLTNAETEYENLKQKKVTDFIIYLDEAWLPWELI